MKRFVIVGLVSIVLLTFLPTETLNTETIKEPTKTGEITNTLSSIEITIQKPNLPKIVSLGEFLITAYCPCISCSDGYGTQTSTGSTCVEGRTIAVDPSVIPYGTTVMFGGNTYTAEDCGGAIKEKRIDLYFSDHQRALNWGRQYHEVFTIVIEE